MFQNLNFKISNIFETQMKNYLLKLILVFSKNVYFRNCGTYKIILVYPTQKYVAFSQLFLNVKFSVNVVLIRVRMLFFSKIKHIHYFRSYDFSKIQKKIIFLSYTKRCSIFPAVFGPFFFSWIVILLKLRINYFFK